MRKMTEYQFIFLICYETVITITVITSLQSYGISNELSP